MWNKDEETTPSQPSVPPSSPSRKQTRIGATVTLQGTLKAEEDLYLEGRLDGEITVASHQVTVGKNGRVKADVNARIIEVEGRVIGDLNGSERVVVAATGNVVGNIKAPRVSLENGAQFRGSIDMDPASGQSRNEPTAVARKGPKPAEAVAPGAEVLSASSKTKASVANS